MTMRVSERASTIVERLMEGVLDDWFRAACVGRCYLAFAPGGEQLLVVREAEPVPEGFELVSPLPMPRCTDRHGALSWMRPLCWRIPVLKTGEA